MQTEILLVSLLKLIFQNKEHCDQNCEGNKIIEKGRGILKALDKEKKKHWSAWLKKNLL